MPGAVLGQAFQTLYYSADQIHHGALPQHVHFVLDEFAASATRS